MKFRQIYRNDARHDGCGGRSSRNGREIMRDSHHVIVSQCRHIWISPALAVEALNRLYNKCINYKKQPNKQQQIKVSILFTKVLKIRCNKCNFIMKTVMIDFKYKEDSK